MAEINLFKLCRVEEKLEYNGVNVYSQKLKEQNDARGTDFKDSIIFWNVPTNETGPTDPLEDRKNSLSSLMGVPQTISAS